MARITVEDCIRYHPNRFEMVVLAGRRGRQLLRGSTSMIKDEGHKSVVQALREIGAGHITWDTIFDQDTRDRQRLNSGPSADTE